MKEINGTLSKVFYRSDTFGTALFRLKDPDPKFPNKDEMRIAGNIPFDERSQFTLYGDWQKHKQYGWQFQVKEWARYYEMTSGGLRNYLVSSIEGCGAKTAELLLETFGLDLEKVITETPDKVIELVGEKKGEKIVKSWLQEGVKASLRKFLANYDVTILKANSIERAWGDQALTKLKTNPYQLVQIRGIGFETADKIAMKMGWEVSSKERASAILYYLLDKASDSGHVCLQREALLMEAARDCQVSQELMGEILDEVLSKGQLRQESVETFAGTICYVYVPYLYDAECSVASQLAQLMEKPIPLPVSGPELEEMITKAEKKLKITATELQKIAVQRLLNSPVSILTGGPGTGKSTTVKLIVEVARKRNWSMLIAAPTGRAAKHITNITGEDAATIHRLLKFNPENHSWFHNAGNPLEADLVIVDEFSMVDVELASRLLEAISVGTHLIIIGDKDQLPAVGPGKVLEDLIRSKRIPTTELNKIFRQAEGSMIITNAHRIIEGDDMRFPANKQEMLTSDVHRINPSKDKSDHLKNHTNNETVIEEIVSLCKTRLPKAKGYDPIKDIQVLVPMRKNRCGVEELNGALQKALNPNGKSHIIANREFRIGDRVMVMKNNYDLNVFNGDMGVIKSVSQEDKAFVVDFYGRLVPYPFSYIDDLSLAYASTIHKSQGSEYPCVILVLLGQHKTMFQRNLLYTGVTRAKQLLIVISYPSFLGECIANRSIKDRTTYLLHRLQKAIPVNVCSSTSLSHPSSSSIPIPS